MEEDKCPRIPKLRTVDKVRPLYLLNKFPSDFALNLGRQIVYLLTTRNTTSLEGSDWECVFANCIGAQWKPSNVGLDDIVLEPCAWGAKSLKSTNPFEIERVRLISGRNSPVYSYGSSISTDMPADPLGKDVLEIWNERVAALRKIYKHLRTVVLIKSNDLLNLAVFEFETIRYDPNLYYWAWNKKNNLEGSLKSTDEHVFTWQPSGSQFTIIEKVHERLKIQIRKPPQLDPETVLRELKFDSSWIKIIK